MKNREDIFTVSEVNRHLKNVIESNIPKLFVEGEIANFTKHYSGHIYFSLKDDKSSLRCVFFRSYNVYLQFQPQVGDKVVCAGKLTVFERAGNYQLNVTRMLPSGVGELQLKFEALKKKLSEEGLFEAQFKKTLPTFPEKIGVVTSATGAAIQDIKNVISRRFPCRILLYPATVQGENAAAEVSSGIRYFNEKKNVDLIIIGRGGGSQEDLFCFNDENLARTIFASEIPIISAVGHEIDFTIADFVADLRAPTPSAAAELAVPDKNEISANLSSLANRLKNGAKQNVSFLKMKISELEFRLEKLHPRAILQEYQQFLDESALKMKHLVSQHLNNLESRLKILQHQLKELSPYEALQRGYSLIRQQKKIVNSVHQLQEKESLEVILSDGSAECDIRQIKPTDNSQKNKEKQ